MNSYYKYFDEELNRQCYFELDRELYCLRAVFEQHGLRFSTNFIYKDFQYQLPEGRYEEYLEEMTKISYQQFHDEWHQSLSPYYDDWVSLKSQLEVGNQIKGTIICFYPQGVIIGFQNKFHGISSYDRCKEKVGEDHMYPNESLDFKITGFDDENMWIDMEPDLPPFE